MSGRSQGRGDKKEMRRAGKKVEGWMMVGNQQCWNLNSGQEPCVLASTKGDALVKLAICTACDVKTKMFG